MTTLPGFHKPLRVADLSEHAQETLPYEDRLQRKEGHWLGMPTYVSLMARWGIRVRKVPADFWSLDATAAIVSCPCGQTPVVEAIVEMTLCECKRGFYFDGSDVWAFNSPAADPAIPEEERDTDPGETPA